MVKVIVFHYSDKGKLPKLSPDELNEFIKSIYEQLKNYPDVKFNGTYVNEEGRGICDWDAPNVEIVNEIIKNIIGEAPADGVIAVKRVL